MVLALIPVPLVEGSFQPSLLMSQGSVSSFLQVDILGFDGNDIGYVLDRIAEQKANRAHPNR